MTEVRAHPGTGFPGPPESSIFVECFVPASPIHTALDLAKEALAHDGYELVDVHRCIRFDLDDWDYDEYPKGSTAHVVVERVLGHGNVEFGPFCFSGPDD
jgi:hypothetical protein